MRDVRKFKNQVLLRIHWFVGIFLGVFLLLIGTSGACLVFKHEIDWALTPSLRVSPAEQRASLDDIFQVISARYPEHFIRAYELPPGSRSALRVHLLRRDGVRESHRKREPMVFVNPQTGTIQGERQGMYPALYLELFHTRLLGNLMGRTATAWGLTIAASFSVVLLTAILSGFFLYRNSFKSMFRIRRRGGRRVLLSDLHRMIGIWSLIFNLMIGITACFFAWSSIKALQRFHSGARPSFIAPPEEGMWQPSQDASLDAMLWRTREHFPQMIVTAIGLPVGSSETIRFVGGHPGLFSGRSDSHVAFSAVSGEILSSANGNERGVIPRANDAIYPLHFGYWGAAYGTFWEYAIKSLWLVLGLTPGVLAVSGSLMYFLRKRRQQDGVRQEADEAEEDLAEVLQER